MIKGKLKLRIIPDKEDEPVFEFERNLDIAIRDSGWRGTRELIFKYGCIVNGVDRNDGICR